MQEPRYESPREGKDALTTAHDISPDLIEELFDGIEEAAPKLIEKYGLDDDVDVENVSKWIKIAFVEDLKRMYDEGGWKGDEVVQRIVDDMRGEHAVSNCRTVSGRVASRDSDMMRLSKEIIQDRWLRSESTDV